MSEPSASDRGSAPLALVLVLALFGFLACTALAAAVYRGGTYCEPAATSYRFWGNYFCDLTAPVTQRGADNSRSAALAEAAFVCFSCATAPFFWLLGGLSARHRPVRLLGLVAAVLGALGTLRAAAPLPVVRLCGWLGFATLLAGFADAAGYAHAVATHAGCVPWLPVLQKLTALGLVSWMFAVAAAAWSLRQHATRLT